MEVIWISQSMMGLTIATTESANHVSLPLASMNLGTRHVRRSTTLQVPAEQEKTTITLFSRSTDEGRSVPCSPPATLGPKLGGHLPEGPFGGGGGRGALPSAYGGAPPGVFVHGCFHLAWRWAERRPPTALLLPRRLRCCALSLLGQV